MQNARFLLYILTVGMVFLGLSAIKMILPHDEPKEPVDEIGMRLYRPIFFGTNDIPEPKSEDVTQEGFQDDVAEETTNEELEVEKTEKPVVEVKPKVAKPKVVASSSSSDAILERMLKDYKATTLKERKYRNDVVVRYYRHVPDGDRAQVLVDYGFYLHERPVSNEYEFENVMSNVIYYGHDFPENDLRLITYLLVKNGVEIKEVRRFKDFDGWKRKAIEIGASPSLVDKPALTADQIQAISIPN